jgi:hypothetical protein
MIRGEQLLQRSNFATRVERDEKNVKPPAAASLQFQTTRKALTDMAPSGEKRGSGGLGAALLPSR